MEHTYYTVAKVAEMLDMHEKTVQRYIREGKLLANKIGKAWRISGHDLSVFLEGDNAPAHPANGKTNASKTIMVSSVVDIDVTNMDEAMSIVNMLTAALNSKQPEFGKSSMNSQFIELESKVRVMLYGNIKFTENIMWVLSNYNNLEK